MNKKLFYIGAGVLASMVLITGLALFFAGNWLLSPVAPPVAPAQTVELTRFVVTRGQTATQTAIKLHEQGFIKHPLAFRLWVRYNNSASQLQAGSFMLSPTMSVAEIAGTLSRGSEDIWITLLEGWRREEIAQYLANQDLPAFDQEEFLRQTATLEGTLFPETYLVPKLIDAAGVVALLQKTYASQITNGLSDEFANSPHSTQEVLTMASLVEREARDYQQMRRVAGILWHRLSIGMPLQVDATMQYAKGYDAVKQTWWPVPLGADRAIVSPFNTYQQTGLPPAPIANPGLRAIQATLDPLPTTDLFYLHAPDGSMHYAQTLEGHNQNINRYLR